MSVIDKVLAAVTPLPDAGRRADATRRARDVATSGDWLSLVLDHHDLIRSAFEDCKAAASAADRRAAMAALAEVLNGHALAEELVLYPALAQAGEKVHAGHAYTEQTTAKMQMAELENIAPSTPEWKDKLAHIEGAVLTHMFEEESGWFLTLKAKSGHDQRLTERYAEEYQRYVGG